MTITETDPGFAAFLFDKLQRLQWRHVGRGAKGDSLCQVCGTALHQLRRLALQKAMGLTGDMPDPRTGSSGPPLFSADDPTAKKPHLADLVPVMPEPRPNDGWIAGESGRRGPHWWGGIQSSYVAGSKDASLATVKPVPMQTQHYLEGVWRVSRARRDHRPHSTTFYGRSCNHLITTVTPGSRLPCSQYDTVFVSRQDCQTPGTFMLLNEMSSSDYVIWGVNQLPRLSRSLSVKAGVCRWLGEHVGEEIKWLCPVGFLDRRSVPLLH
ncbi:hypothetical protein DPEC_G00321290 [Dallia pectoralis]|uniref:Uncharacterized protein n=1 Tax=Dallia pectoralis TaxID=75939 RepID=A0ACC2FAE0_DALPE|nr:hypothetical protein DPEC_G00321290 [Dallia pectoralis]